MITIHSLQKIAAPASPRSKWNRFWTRVQNPLTNNRGKDADTRFEMNAVLESMMKIKQGTDQIKNYITQLRTYASQLPSIISIVQNLNNSNWNNLSSSIQQIEQIIERNQATRTAQTMTSSPDPVSNRWTANSGNATTQTAVDPATQMQQTHQQIYQQDAVSLVSNLVRNMKSSISEVNSAIQDIQSTMYNLRQRDAIKGGRNSNSAVKEYSDMDRALNRLYANPLDEKALYYAQKMQGQLEDALNMRANTPDNTFDEWANQPPQENSDPISAINPEPAFNQQPLSESPQGQTPQSMQSASQMIADTLSQSTDESTLKQLVDVLKGIMTGPVTPENQQKIQVLVDALSNSPGPQPLQSPASPSVPNAAPSMVTSRGIGGTPTTTQPNAIDGDDEWYEDINASTNDSFTKLAQTVEIYDKELANVLKEYLNDEEPFPRFPQKSNILQEKFQENKGLFN
jgi:hypothetical protein